MDSMPFKIPETADLIVARRPDLPTLEVPLSESTTFDARGILHDVYRTVSDGPFEDRDDILHQLRGLKEYIHRGAALDSILFPMPCRLSNGKYRPMIWKPGKETDRQWGWLERIIDCHNKSVAIYSLDPDEHASHLGNGILKFLDIWLYRQWFTPYESVIEFGRYIAKTVRLKREPGKITLDEILDIHESLCQNLAGAVSNDLPPELVEILAKYFLPRQEEGFTSVEHTIAAFNTFYRLEPSLKAFFIVLDPTFGFEDGPFEADDIGNMPVRLVCTNEGLKNRVFLERFVRDENSILRNASSAFSVETTFKSAYQFIMDLENQQSHNRLATTTLIILTISGKERFKWGGMNGSTEGSRLISRLLLG
ncbi:hypothetical protein ACLX1H_008027 [Fusarium chlamydosporum]